MKLNDIKPINKNFLAVYYLQEPRFLQNIFKDSLESSHKFIKEIKEKVDKGYVPNYDELFMAHHKRDIENTIFKLHYQNEIEVFYIPESVQEHINLIYSYNELLNYYKIDMKFISSLKNENSIYIINEKEFFIFFIEEQEKMVVWYFIEDENGCVKPTEFICCLKEEWVTNLNFNDEIANKFIKILLFMNFDKISIEVLENNETINFEQNDSKFNKIINESGSIINLVRIGQD